MKNNDEILSDVITFIKQRIELVEIDLKDNENHLLLLKGKRGLQMNERNARLTDHKHSLDKLLEIATGETMFFETPRKQFDFFFTEVIPKNMVEFKKQIDQGNLWAFEKEDRGEFPITETHNPVEIINTQLYWFGTEK